MFKMLGVELARCFFFGEPNHDERCQAGARVQGSCRSETLAQGKLGWKMPQYSLLKVFFWLFGPARAAWARDPMTVVPL